VLVMKSYILRNRNHYCDDTIPFSDLVALYEKTVDEISKENAELQLL
jgi:hypothetical protein